MWANRRHESTKHNKTLGIFHGTFGMCQLSPFFTILETHQVGFFLQPQKKYKNEVDMEFFSQVSVTVNSLVPRRSGNNFEFVNFKLIHWLIDIFRFFLTFGRRVIVVTSVCPSVCLSVPIILVNTITQSVYPISPPNLLGGFNMALSWMVL